MNESKIKLGFLQNPIISHNLFPVNGNYLKILILYFVHILICAPVIFFNKKNNVFFTVIDVQIPSRKYADIPSDENHVRLNI